ncbi:FAD-dependent oxidoreductase [Cohnella terricola]|uniref:FAD-dependent oxidoreductase n=1 Tax=Cohnella terricola TaxID=1289167 RepID=A0A559JQN0_9BACL|nr:FAD-dependent oxidoreductase [Cohnella terricola]TVY02186.1 FAD-dependent oxidoreductase [Cohnella terricola]
MKQLPQFPQSYWTASVELPEFPRLQSDIEADVVIVGAGITGITAGYLLSKAGVKTAILEAGRILNGTTGHTTAKITAQHDVIYDELIQHFGEDQARLYYEANRDALNFIRNTVASENISCGLENEHAYIYAQSDHGITQLTNERRAYEKLGIPGDLTDRIDLPISIKSALVMRDQAQFHPLKYLMALIDRVVRTESQIFENTTVMKVEEGDRPVVVTEDGHRVRCRHVISASHFPFLDWKGFYFARMHAERSYVLGVRIEGEYGGGMYISADDPKRSIRVAREGDSPLILIGGQGHKAGQSACTFDHYLALEAFADYMYRVKDIPYRWSTQDLVTLDKLPYVGRINARTDNIFVATGYRKWGMTNGTAAAHLLTNLVLGAEDRYRELFDPSRLHADPDIKSFITSNADVAKQLVVGKLEMVYRSPDSLNENEGALVRVNGKRAGAYRDPEGVLHLVDTTCTHLGCETNWNDGDRTWDCPCHGSRFSYTGEVIEGPAKEPLARLEPAGKA